MLHLPKTEIRKGNRSGVYSPRNEAGHSLHDSALLWLIQLLTTGVPELDFETVTLYSLTIYAKDNRGATASQTILIPIADVNEPPTFSGPLAHGDQGTELLFWGRKDPVDTYVWSLCPGSYVLSWCHGCASDKENNDKGLPLIGH